MLSSISLGHGDRVVKLRTTGGFAWSFLNNTDFYGFNDGAQVVPTMEDCANLCMNKPSCVAASWNGPGSQYHDNNCNLHCSTAGRRTMQGETAVLVRPQGPNCKSPPPPPPPTPSIPGWMPGQPVVLWVELVLSVDFTSRAERCKGEEFFRIGR